MVPCGITVKVNIGVEVFHPYINLGSDAARHYQKDILKTIMSRYLVEKTARKVCTFFHH
jgi:hypothetical protein